MNTTYDIVMRDEDFVLYVDGKPLISPAGNEVSHTNARLLRSAISYEFFNKNETISLLSLLIKLSDINARAIPELNFSIAEAIDNDILLKKDQVISDTISKLMIHEDFPLTDYIFLNSSSMASSLAVFLSHKNEDQPTNEFIASYIKKLSTEQKSALNFLAETHGCGIIIHLLLLSGHLSLSEYAAALVILKLRENCKEISHSLEECGIAGIGQLQNSIIANSQIIIDFLTLCKNENKTSVIEEIINRGENDQTEFKSTLRWDLRQGIKNAAIEHASLKTICAFLNSEGGDLLIGVRDDGSIEGIETDKFENEDKFLLHIWTLIKSCMGQEVVEWVKTSLQKFGDKTVCRVSCKRAAKPIFLNQKGFAEKFFIRVGPSSSNLEISSALKYIQQHF